MYGMDISGFESQSTARVALARSSDPPEATTDH